MNWLAIAIEQDEELLKATYRDIERLKEYAKYLEEKIEEGRKTLNE